MSVCCASCGAACAASAASCAACGAVVAAMAVRQSERDASEGGGATLDAPLTPAQKKRALVVIAIALLCLGVILVLLAMTTH